MSYLGNFNCARMMRSREPAFGELPCVGYGFQFHSGEDSSDEGGFLEMRRLPDATVTLAGGDSYTYRTMVGDGFDHACLKIVEAQAYLGETVSGETEVIGKIRGSVFNLNDEEMAGEALPFIGRGLHVVADAVSREVYDAIRTLFTYRGIPTKSFAEAVAEKPFGRYPGHNSLLYIEGVFLKKEHMGKDLGLDMIRGLIKALRADVFPVDLVVLSPAGDPPRGDFRMAFSKLVVHFGKMGFKICGKGVTDIGMGQGEYMFLEPETLDPAALEYPAGTQPCKRGAGGPHDDDAEHKLQRKSEVDTAQ